MTESLSIATPGIVWKSLEPRHLDLLVDFIVQMERIDNPPYRTTAAEVEQIFSSVYSGMLGWDSDSKLVAYAIVRLVENNGLQAICSGGVAVPWRNRGVGSAVFQWEVATARQMLQGRELPAQIVCFVDKSSANMSSAMYTYGFEKAHSFLELRRDLALAVEPVEPGQYLQIVPWSADLDDQVRRAHNHLMEITAGAPAQRT